jgi:hypothetical protein
VSKAAVAARTVIRDNNSYLELLVNLTKALSITDYGDPYTVENIKKEIDYLIEDVKTDDSADDETVTLKLFIDQGNKLLGEGIEVSEVSVIFALKEGAGYTMKVESPDQDFSIYGDLKKSSGTYAGTVFFDNGSVGKIGEFSGLKTVKYHGMDTPVGVFSFEVKDWLKLGGVDMSNDLVKLANDLKGSFSVSQEGEISKLEFDINNGSDASITMEFSGQSIDEDLTITKPASFIDLDMTNPTAGIDFDKMLEGLKKIFDNLEDLGYDFQSVYDMMEASLGFYKGAGFGDYEDYNFDDYDWGSDDYDFDFDSGSDTDDQSTSDGITLENLSALGISISDLNALGVTLDDINKLGVSFDDLKSLADYGIKLEDLIQYMQ